MTQQNDQFYAESILIMLRRIIRSVDLHSRKLVQVFGLTGPQLFLLTEIIKCEQPSISDLAQRVHLSHATVTDILYRLEKRNLVTRERSASDKRRVTVRATDEGRKLVEQKPSLLQEKLVEEFAKLQDWEKTLMLSSLQRVVTMMEMEKETLDSSPILTTGPISASSEQSLRYLTGQDLQHVEQLTVERPNETGDKRELRKK